MSRVSKPLLVYLVVGIGGCQLTCLLMGYWCFHPRDEVKITAKNFPPDAKTASLLVEKDGERRMMTRTVRAPCVLPFKMHLRPGPGVYLNGEPPKIDHDYHVIWDWGARYGVLSQNKAGTWHVFWFTPDEVTLEERSWILGGGVVNLDLAGRAGELVPVAQLRDLGLRAPLIPE